MEPTRTGTVLSHDLVSALGDRIARRGDIVDYERLRDVASRAPARTDRERPLHETSVATAILQAFDAPALGFIVGSDAVRGELADTLAEVRYPDAVWAELDSLQAEDPQRFHHAVWSAVVAARLFRTALGDAPGLRPLAGSALVHDLGMRHVPMRLRYKRDHLSRGEALALESHPLLGALLLAHSLGDCPAVQFALLHHTRRGFGYPRLARPLPLRGLDILAVSGAFAALISPRPFRQGSFDARGAADELLAEARRGHFDERAVRLLIFCLRGARGAASLSELSLPRRSTGQRPTSNCHGTAALLRTGST